MPSVATRVVLDDALGQHAVVVAIAMHRHRARQAQADVAGFQRVADAEAGDRKDLVRQAEHRRDLVDLVAQHADRAAAQTGRFGREDESLHHQCRIDRGVEETFERAVGDRLGAHLADAFEPARIAEKDEEDRRVLDPRHRREQRADRGTGRRIGQPQQRGLLEVGLGGGAEGGGAQQVEQGLGGLAVGVAPHGVPGQHLAHERDVDRLVARGAVVVETLAKQIRVHRAGSGRAAK